MSKPVTNIPASIRQRLVNLARERNQLFDLVLTRYALERFLYRLSVSRHSNHFVLKGAMLVTSWIEAPFRATRDLDFLAFGDQEPVAMREVFCEICATPQEDGLVFPAAAIAVEVNREDATYSGLRIRAQAFLDKARIPIIIDLGFGDRMVPEPTEISYPVLLDQPAPKLRAYAIETVIAEKFQAMVVLGRANSRMKDFYDIWVLARTERLEPARLMDAIAATFAQRETPIPTDIPDALTAAFAADPRKQEQWAAFARDNLQASAGHDLKLPELIAELAAFLMPLARAAASNSAQSSS